MAAVMAKWRNALQEQTRYANNNLAHESNRGLEREIAQQAAKIQQLENGPQSMGGGTQHLIRFHRQMMQDAIDELETRGVGVSTVQPGPYFANQQVRSPAQQMVPDMDFMDAYQQNSRISRAESKRIKRQRIVQRRFWRRNWKEQQRNKLYGRNEANVVLREMKKRPQETSRAIKKRVLRHYRRIARTGEDPYGAITRQTKLDMKRELAVEKLRAHHKAEQAYYDKWGDDFDPDNPETHKPPLAWI